MSELAKPLSPWEKIKTGVSSFVGSALKYLPSGILFAAAIMGGSALLETAFPGVGFLGITKAFEHGGFVGGILPRLGMTLLIGGAISGSMGAWQGIQKATGEREALRAQQAGIVARHQSQGAEQHIAYDGPVSPQIGLPTGAPLSKHHTQGIV
jgi:hypothetical protein